MSELNKVEFTEKFGIKKKNLKGDEIILMTGKVNTVFAWIEENYVAKSESELAVRKAWSEGYERGQFEEKHNIVPETEQF